MRCGTWLGALRWTAAFAALLAVSGTAGRSAAAGPNAPDAPTVAFRLFLTDGTPVATLGEFTRVGGRVIFTLPLGSGGEPASVQLVSLPDHVIDWDRTNRYTDAVRAKRYADSRGEAEFAALTLDVARALSEIAVSAEPARRLAIAEQARRRLVEWPRTHYAYRMEDVRDLALVVDETIASIQADIGEHSFTIDLVAMTEAPAEALLPEPTIRESIASAVAVARHSDVPAERIPLQQAILAVLDPKRRDLPSGWAASERRSLESALRADARTNLRYAQLVRSALEDAALRAARSDVEGLERLLDQVRREDAKLGHERPGQMAALMATLESYSRLAQRRRLEQQLVARRLADHPEYRQGTSAVIRGLRQMARDLADIAARTRPDDTRLERAAATLKAYEETLEGLTPPVELGIAHQHLLTSIRLMREAARLSRESAGPGGEEAAMNASAAAAGAQLLLSRARTDIAAFFEGPQRR